MFVSIIVPVYNVSGYVSRCLESIAAQTYQDYEVIVMEGNSTDGSREIVTEFCNSHPKFRPILQEKPIGLMGSWMEAIPLAKGDYIEFLDGDDYMAPTLIERLVEKTLEYDTDITIANFNYCRENGFEKHENPIKEGLYAGKDIEIIHRAIFPTVEKHYLSPARCDRLIRKSIFEANLKYCDPFISSAEDVNIMVPVILSTKTIYYIDEPLSYYVYRPSSITHVFRPDTLEMYFRLIRILEQAVRDKGLGYKREVENLFNTYGVHWMVYVANAELPMSEKLRYANQLFEDKRFVKSARLLSYKLRPTIVAYKLMMKFHSPCIYLYFTSFIKRLRG